MLENFAKSIIKTVPQWVKSCEIVHNEIMITVHPEFIVPMCYFLRQNMLTRCAQLLDVTAVDYPDRDKRFTVVYNLLSIDWNARIRLKTEVDELTPIESVTSVYASAGWWEREVWDLFGIFFTNHPDLRRILTDYGFQGHPLRKDFPLTGYTEVRYDATEKRVISEPLELSQEFRSFDFASPWESLDKSTK
uniref:NADH dehydrogenase subunit 9 n=1 Tax=Medakamo hakoo TaxID=3113649 RepID=A0A8D5TEF0_9CHLO|nr:NADH dehydrogenase subunit 9 [Medakamo hakoo]